MDEKLRKAQESFLKGFAEADSGFALAGGTALELFYLKHRFSFDLDFFSTDYKVEEIKKIVSSAQKYFKSRIVLENEFNVAGKAKVMFYTVELAGSDRPLKIDFVEDVFIEEPRIKKIDKVKVYSVEDIYFHKIAAVSGVSSEFDEIGRRLFSGRRKMRDVFDLYMLSKKVCALSEFLEKVSPVFQRGMVHWYRTFSRQEFKLGLLDLDIYDEDIDAKEIIIYLENQVKEFISKKIW